MSGFEIKKIGGEIFSVSFQCTECDESIPYLSRSSIAYGNKLNENFKPCCRRFQASDEILLALDFLDAKQMKNIAEEKLSSTKSNFTTYIVFGVAPLILGVLFGNQFLVSLGIGTTALVIIFWFCTR
jgi:hypothetical protein